MLAAFQSRFRYILVDEYQDTNAVQYLWLRLLAQGHGNVCCVGDDDQSIYGWRGADVDNILRFEKDFPGARVIRLERNYRSGGHILAVAAGLIAHNQRRLGKTLFTDAPPGDKPTVTGVWDSQEEARVVGDEIEDAQRAGRLARRHRHSGARLVPDARIRGALHRAGPALQGDRRPALLRAGGNPRRARLSALRRAARRRPRLRAHLQPAEARPRRRDPRHLARIRPPRRRLADARGAAADRDRGTEGAAAPDPARPARNFDRWRKAAEEIPHEEVAQLVLEESGYIDMWKAERTPDAAGRLDNLKELVRSMGEFPDLGAFLEHVSLVMDAESADAGQRVSIMTLHAAKGLEFDVVFLPGWEEGLFPHQRSLDDNGRAGLEEERRLAYVGLTRARRKAKIYFAANRRIRGLWQTSTPSRFIDELPPDHVAVEETEGAAAYGGYGVSRFDAAGFGGPYETPGWRRAEFSPNAATGRASAGPRRGVVRRQGRRRAPRPRPGSKRARGSSTSSSGRAAWWRSTGRSSPSISTRPAASW